MEKYYQNEYYYFNGEDFFNTLRELYIEYQNKLPQGKNLPPFTQKALADLIGIEASYITKWKKGTRPSYDHLLMISNSLNCSIETLLGLKRIENQEKDIWDIFRDIFIYDMNNSEYIPDDKEIFQMLSSFEHTYMAIYFKKSKNENLIISYFKMKQAFKYLDTETNIMLIDKMINNYRNDNNNAQE